MDTFYGITWEKDFFILKGRRETKPGILGEHMVEETRSDVGSGFHKATEVIVSSEGDRQIQTASLNTDKLRSNSSTRPR